MLSARIHLSILFRDLSWWGLDFTSGMASLAERSQLQAQQVSPTNTHKQPATPARCICHLMLCVAKAQETADECQPIIYHTSIAA